MEFGTLQLLSMARNTFLVELGSNGAVPVAQSWAILTRLRTWVRPRSPRTCSRTTWGPRGATGSGGTGTICSTTTATTSPTRPPSSWWGRGSPDISWIFQGRSSPRPWDRCWLQCSNKWLQVEHRYPSPTILEHHQFHSQQQHHQPVSKVMLHPHHQ